MSLTTERPVNTAPRTLATRDRTRITIDTADIPRLPRHVNLLDLGHGFTISPLLQDLRTHNPDTEFATFKLDYFPENLAMLGGIRVAADAVALPFHPETFDVVTSAQLTKDNPYFRHMPGRLTAMAQEVGRILKPGGLYLVYNEVPNVVTPPALKQYLK